MSKRPTSSNRDLAIKTVQFNKTITQIDVPAPPDQVSIHPGLGSKTDRQKTCRLRREGGCRETCRSVVRALIAIAACAIRVSKRILGQTCPDLTEKFEPFVQSSD